MPWQHLFLNLKLTTSHEEEHTCTVHQQTGVK